MDTLMPTMRLIALAVACAGLFTVPTAFAQSGSAKKSDPVVQIPSDGVFYACMRVDKDGDEGRLVRLVAATEECKPQEQRISWNVTGRQGYSVAMETVPVQTAQCIGLGGVKLTLVDENNKQVPGSTPQFVCNGEPGVQGIQGPAGPAGTTGQLARTEFGSDTKQFTAASATFEALPGLSLIVNVPANAVVLVTSDGGARYNGAANGGATVDVRLTVNGVQSGPIRRVSPQNTAITGYDVWSLVQTLDLAPGTYSFAIEARLIQAAPGTTSVFVSGSATTESAERGSLSAVILKK